MEDGLNVKSSIAVFVGISVGTLDGRRDGADEPCPFDSLEGSLVGETVDGTEVRSSTPSIVGTIVGTHEGNEDGITDIF